MYASLDSEESKKIDHEFEAKAKIIMKEAIKKLDSLVKSMDVKIFDSTYAIHRYVKHNDLEGLIASGLTVFSTLLDDMMENKNGSEAQRDPLFYALTQQRIKAHKKEIYDEELQEAANLVKYGKAKILEGEKKLKELMEKKENEEIV